jgi:hypothetical protein
MAINRANPGRDIRLRLPCWYDHRGEIASLNLNTLSVERSVDLTGISSGPGPQISLSTKRTSPFRLMRMTVEIMVPYARRGRELSNVRRASARPQCLGAIRRKRRSGWCSEARIRNRGLPGDSFWEADMR